MFYKILIPVSLEREILTAPLDLRVQSVSDMRKSQGLKGSLCCELK